MPLDYGANLMTSSGGRSDTARVADREQNRDLRRHVGLQGHSLRRPHGWRGPILGELGGDAFADLASAGQLELVAALSAHKHRPFRRRPGECYGVRPVRLRLQAIAPAGHARRRWPVPPRHHRERSAGPDGHPRGKGRPLRTCCWARPGWCHGTCKVCRHCRLSGSRRRPSARSPDTVVLRPCPRDWGWCPSSGRHPCPATRSSPWLQPCPPTCRS